MNRPRALAAAAPVMTALAVMALAVMVACGGGGQNGGSGSSTSSDVTPKPTRAGRLDTVFVQNVTVDGEVVTSARDLPERATLVSDANGQFGFSLTKKIKQCRTDPSSTLQVLPATGELIRLDAGTSYCKTTTDAQEIKFGAGDRVVLTMADPTFGVTVAGQRVVVKVEQGKLQVSVNGTDAGEVEEGQQITLSTGGGTTIPPRPVPVELTAKEQCIFRALQADRAPNCADVPPTTSTTIDNTPPSTPASLRAARVAGPPCLVVLTWSASADNVGVAGYTVFRNERAIATVDPKMTDFDDMAPSQNSSTYAVDAFDQAGNHSKRSESATVPGCLG